jgi:hypothetical protein
MREIVVLVGVLLFVVGACNKAVVPEQDVSGEWTYRLDTNEVGEHEMWFSHAFADTIMLPGALRDYGIGDVPTLQTQWTGSIYDSSWFFNPAMEKYRQPGDLKFPFWLTPVKHYVGMAWYQKEVSMPKAWSGKNVELFLEYPHWQTTVWFDTLKIGSDNSLSTPHRFVIPAQVITNGKHRITVRVDNAIRDIDPGINSHSISDHTQGNWNGIVGAIKMRPLSPIHITQVKITPNLKEQWIHVKVVLSGAMAQGKLKFEVEGLNHAHALPSQSVSVQQGSDTVQFKVAMGETVKTWSEFAPNLYALTVSLSGQEGVVDAKTVQFGMREFTVNDKRFEINGIPVFLRGTTECCVFPLTGYAPTNEKEWERIFDICKSFGLNHMRFHSYCPPRAAFLAADKAGFYLQVEGPSWAKYSVTLGDGKPIDAYLMDETKRIIDTYGNHPSFCMMAYGNEPSGNYVPYLENWVSHFRAYDPQRVFTGASTGRSWAIIDNSDFIVRSPPRGLEWPNKQPESQFDYRNKTENQNRPYVTFEMGQWCAFPNFKEIEKYTGSLKAKNFELFRSDLADKHMSHLSNDFLMASGKLQTSCYKQEIEATLRTPNLAGFQLLSLNDFSGQGTALVGVLDAFWDEKGYVTAREFSAFCNRVVPLVRLDKFTFQSADTMMASVEVANFSGRELVNPQVAWKLTNGSKTIVEGRLSPSTIAMGNGIEMGKLAVPLNFATEAQQLTLSVAVDGYENSWKIWVYPSSPNITGQSQVVVANKLEKEVIQALESGKAVLLLTSGLVENGKDVVQHFTPAFWNTSWFRMRPPHTTGILIHHKHPVFNHFPTDYYSDMQWWELANRQQVMNLEYFPTDFRPLVQPIDTWFMNRRLAMLFEAKVLNGKLMVCSIDFAGDLNDRPVARQLRESVLQYMNSEQFNPAATIDYKTIAELFEKKERQGWKSYVNDEP